MLVLLPLLYAAGADRRAAVMTSTRLAQVSEFCLVIAYLGRNLGHVSAEVVAAVIFAFVLTALVTPPLFALSDSLDARLGPLLARLGMRAPAPPGDAEAGGGARPRIALLGFHRLASSLLHDLERAGPELAERVLVVDLNVAPHAALRARGVTVVYGDVANVETLKHAHVDRADVVVSTVPDDLLKGTTNLKLAGAFRKLAPRSKIVVNAIRLADVPAMYAAGADYVFSWRTETSFGLVPALRAMLEGAGDDYRERARRPGRDLLDRAELLD